MTISPERKFTNHRNANAKMTAVGERITILRQAKGWTAKILADKAGIGINTLTSMVWRLPREPSLFKLEYVAQALDVPTWSLFEDAPIHGLDDI